MPRTLSNDSSGSVTNPDINRGCGDANQTPLMVASIIGSSRVVTNLLSQGASVSATDDDGFTALHHSMLNNQLAASKALITGGADLEAMPRGFGHEGIDGTPLHIAATTGFHRGMRVLIDAGANVDCQLDCGASPLFFSANEGCLEATRVLMRANANPLLSTYGCLPLEMAVLNGHQRVVEELVWWYGVDRCTSDGGVLTLTAAASQGDVGITAFLSDVGVADNKAVALCAAIESCSEECVQFLLRKKGGNTCISAGAYVSIDHGSLPGSYDEYVYQETPLVSTFMMGSFHAPRFARLLLEAGADTTSSIRFPCDSGKKKGFRGTHMELATVYSDKFDSHPYIEHDTVAGLKGVMRVMKQVDAIHAVSWLWPVTKSNLPADSGPRKKSAPIVRMVQRRVTRARVLLPRLLAKYSSKKDGAFQGY